jgi:plasmid replication initiation protein
MLDNQLALFEASKSVPGAVRDEQSIMSFPFFSLSKSPTHDTLVFEHKGIKLKVEPGRKGRATIYDADMLLFCATILNQAVDSGNVHSRRIGFRAATFLKFSGRGRGGNRYLAMRDMLYRLKTTMFVTNIETGGKRREAGFSLIDNYTIEEDTGRLEIWINEWFYDAIVKDRAVIPVHPEYFMIKNPTARKIYEVAKRHIGRDLTWSIGLINLQKRVGHMSEPRKFKAKLEQIAAENTLPEFSIMIMKAGPNEDGYGKGAHKITFIRRRQ